MDPLTLAAALFERAAAAEQAVHRIAAGDDVPAIRHEVRRLAREGGVRIRTGLLGDTLVVIRADASLWHEPTAVMRDKLRPSD